MRWICFLCTLAALLNIILVKFQSKQGLNNELIGGVVNGEFEMTDWPVPKQGKYWGQHYIRIIFWLK